MNSLNFAIENFKKNIYNYKFISSSNLLYLIIILIFIYIAYSIYKKYIIPKISPDFVLNKEIKIDNLTKNQPKIIFFKTNWCPYCNSDDVLLSIKKIKKEIEDNNTNKKTEDKILFITVDCDENKEICKKYNVNTYPEIKLLYENEIYDFEAKIDYKNLSEFLKAIIVDFN